MTQNSGTTVVLGWDALDYQLLGEFGLRDSFGACTKRIETFRNPVAGEPHTREVWPSIITGVPPDTHGIHAMTEGDGVEWDNPYLDAVSSAANHCIPQIIRTAIGERLRERGAAVQQYTPKYYQEAGVSTIFDGRLARPLSIPNYQTAFDRHVGLTSGRDDIWAQLIGSKDGIDGYEPSAPMDVVEHVLFREAGERIGHVRAAVTREYDIVFCWLGLIDTAGHIEPAAADPIVRRSYEYAAEATGAIRDALEPEDRLVCVSDHGLRDGKHTMDATLATDNDAIAESVASVFDVHAALDAVTPRRKGQTTSPVRGGTQAERHGERAAPGEVQDRLEDLGYV